MNMFVLFLNFLPFPNLHIQRCTLIPPLFMVTAKLDEEDYSNEAVSAQKVLDVYCILCV